MCAIDVPKRYIWKSKKRFNNVSCDTYSASSREHILTDQEQYEARLEYYVGKCGEEYRDFFVKLEEAAVTFLCDEGASFVRKNTMEDKNLDKIIYLTMPEFIIKH